jgi:hypothetical protein
MLELSSNSIKVVGIFGRLSKENEIFLDEIEQQCSNKPPGDEYAIFRHLTLTFIPNATVSDVKNQLTLLKSLNKFLPLKIEVKNAFIKNEESLEEAEHIAIEFDLAQTKEITDFIKTHCPDHTVETWYIKVVWFVPKENQKTALKRVLELKELEFSDFYLVANKQDEANTIFTTQSFN